MAVLFGMYGRQQYRTNSSVLSFCHGGGADLGKNEYFDGFFEFFRSTKLIFRDLVSTIITQI